LLDGEQFWYISGVTFRFCDSAAAAADGFTVSDWVTGFLPTFAVGDDAVLRRFCQSGAVPAVFLPTPVTVGGWTGAFFTCFFTSQTFFASSLLSSV